MLCAKICSESHCITIWNLKKNLCLPQPSSQEKWDDLTYRFIATHNKLEKAI